jgi:beta-glucanase (GH16 family)
LPFLSRYGYWESSVKWGDTNGMWSAIWMQSPAMGTYLSDHGAGGLDMTYLWYNGKESQ